MSCSHCPSLWWLRPEFKRLYYTFYHLMIMLCGLLGITFISSLIASGMASDPQVQIFFRSLVGASLGAFVGLSLWPGTTLKQNACLIGVNLIFGAVAGPMLYLWTVERKMFTEGFILMVGCGAGTSSFGMALLRMALPFFPIIVRVTFDVLCPAPLKALLYKKRLDRKAKKHNEIRQHLP